MELVLDASPLIYLSKLDAFDAVALAEYEAVVPLSVFAEAARPELAFRYPEIATITRMADERRLRVVALEPHEVAVAAELKLTYGGLHAGELDVLALGQARGWTVYFHERQAARLARALGLVTVHLVEVLFAGTPASDVLERRLRDLARLTNMRIDDLDALLSLARERR